MQIHELRIERFRGIETLTWRPAPGMNCLIGPGDAGKSTILAAIELLFSSRGGLVASEYDYHRRRVDEGFEIHAIVGDLPDEFQSAQRVPVLHGWKGGELLGLPDEGGAEPVIHICARGTADMEVEHRILTPSGGESRFGVGLRRRLDVARLTGLTRAYC